MGLFRKMERRHIVCNKHRTTIAMEPEFWKAAESLAGTSGMTWKQWTAIQLDSKPEEVGRASWLRLGILKSTTRAAQGAAILVFCESLKSRKRSKNGADLTA